MPTDPRSRFLRPFSIVAALAIASAAPAIQAPPQPPGRTALLGGNIDSRVNAKDLQERAVAARGDAARTAAIAGVGRAQAVANAAADLAARVPGVTVELSAFTGGPELVHNPGGPLTAAALGKSSESIVRSFLAANREVYGLDTADLDRLVVLGDSPGGKSGLRMLRLEQQLEGLSIFQSETSFILDRSGRLWRTIGTLVPGATASAPKIDRAHLLSPAEALVRLLAAAGIDAKVADVTTRTLARDPVYGDRLELAAPAPVAGPGSARLVLFPLAPGLLVPAWSLTVFTSGDEDWYALVDAETGDLLWRKNMREHASTHQARFSVYVAADGKTPADSPAPQSPSPALPGGGTQYPEIARTTVNMLTVQSLTASPNGWIDDCPGGGDGCNTTRGNNVDACVDNAGPDNTCDSVLDITGRPQGNSDGTRDRDFFGAAPRDFDYAPPPVGGNANVGDTPTNADYRRGATVQLFYITNWYHDRLFALGFDEPSRNFQQVNFQGLGGAAGDRVAADVQNAGTNNANFSTPADGAGPGRMQMFLFTGPTPDRDGDLDAEIVIHELTHGTSNRLVGNATGLLWDPARGMGEGWSDFYALSLLNATNADNPNSRYATGAYATYQLAALTDNYVYGIRRFPYSTDNSVNPLTWADVDDVTAADTGGITVSPLAFSNAGGNEVHNSGEIWALSLWEMRARMIADPAVGNNDVPTGGDAALQLVTDALKMTPSNPTFTSARDALFAADCAANPACLNEGSIWGGFADRGLGYGASAPLAIMGRFARSHMGIKESFSSPYLDVVNPAVAVVINDSPLGNGDGRLDPGETATLTVTLTNPWRGTSRNATGITATLSSSTPGVSVPDPNGAYPNIAPQGTGTNSGNTFQVTLSGAATCGRSVWFTLTTVSSLGTTATTFGVRVGTPGAAGPAVTYTHTPGLAIPDGRGDGVSTNLSVSDDLEIADLDFRVTSLTHTWTGDVTVMLRSPDGYGLDLIWRRGELFGAGTGDADNFTNTVIDDDLAIVATEDLNQSAAAAAPFTGDWLPAFNSPFWNTLATTPPVARDPVGQLGRLDGTSTAGIWSVNVSDGTAPDTGTLNSWAIIVQPRTFSCTPFLSPLLTDGFEAGTTGAWSAAIQ